MWLLWVTSEQFREIAKRDDHECFARFGFVPDFGPGSFAFFDKVDFISSMKFVDSMPDQKLEENQENVEFWILAIFGSFTYFKHFSIRFIIFLK